MKKKKKKKKSRIFRDALKNPMCPTALSVAKSCKFVYLHLPLTFIRWTISDQLASYTDEDQLIVWRCR